MSYKEPATKKFKKENEEPSLPISSEEADGCPPTIDLDSLKAAWSPGREQKRHKIRSARDGPLRGGDWVLNKNGAGATLSFCFAHKGEKYGLTVGRLAPDGIGSPIYCFAQSSMLEDPLHDSDLGLQSDSYYLIEIGEVVSKSCKTNSLVFKVNEIAELAEVGELETLAPKSGLDRPLQLPKPGVIKRPNVGDVLVGFGAQRRGTCGVVHSAHERGNGAFSRVGNICMKHTDGDSFKVADPGW